MVAWKGPRERAGERGDKATKIHLIRSAVIDILGSVAEATDRRLVVRLKHESEASVMDERENHAEFVRRRYYM